MASLSWDAHFEASDFQVVFLDFLLDGVGVVHPLVVPHDPHLAILAFGGAQLGAVARAVAVPFG